MAKTDDVSRAGPSLSRLAWHAQRPGGAEALASLQDEVDEAYGPELLAAVEHAGRIRRRTGKTAYVLFSPSMERAYRRMRTTGARREVYPGYTESTLRFYRRDHWPFVVTTRPEESRAIAPVIWDTARMFGTHGRAAERREAWREQGERMARRRRERTANDPSRQELRPYYYLDYREALERAKRMAKENDEKSYVARGADPRKPERAEYAVAKLGALPPGFYTVAVVHPNGRIAMSGGRYHRMTQRRQKLLKSRDPARRSSGRPRPTARQAAFIHEKIPTLIDEGYPQRQAVAIAYRMAGVPPLPERRRR